MGSMCVSLYFSPHLPADPVLRIACFRPAFPFDVLCFLCVRVFCGVSLPPVRCGCNSNACVVTMVDCCRERGLALLYRSLPIVVGLCELTVARFPPEENATSCHWCELNLNGAMGSR